MTSLRLHRIIALAVLLLQAGCSAITEAESDYTRARLRWSSERPSAYDYTTSVSCFCVSDVLRSVVVVVRGNTVESLTYVDNGQPVSATWAPTYVTIDGMFDLIANAIDNNAARVDVTYDPTFGFPTSIALDYRTNVADDESWYSLGNFHVR